MSFVGPLDLGTKVLLQVLSQCCGACEQKIDHNSEGVQEI